MEYSNVPLPVAFTTIIPVEAVQLGCVTVDADTIGGVQQPVAAESVTFP
jgi:hypothetical protein